MDYERVGYSACNPQNISDPQTHSESFALENLQTRTDIDYVPIDRLLHVLVIGRSDKQLLQVLLIRDDVVNVSCWDYSHVVANRLRCALQISDIVIMFRLMSVTQAYCDKTTEAMITVFTET